MSIKFAIMNKEILRLALPAIVTNITVPLLGLVDTAITGHLDKTAYIGAVSVGATLFNMIYWNFGFLRMGTSGQTAQAYGRKDSQECTDILLRGLLFVAMFSVAIWIIQKPLLTLAFGLMETTPDVELYARQYFGICIIGAPAVLGMYCFKGWFIGMQNTKYTMYVAIAINVVNIMLSLSLVIGLGMQVKGVALGTVVSQYVGLIMCAMLWRKNYWQMLKDRASRKLLTRIKVKEFFRLNGAIFLRTLCLNAVMSFFTFAGASQGEIILAVNVLMMQFFNLVSYFTDGFAYAGEALTGRFVGAKDIENLRKSIIQIFKWGAALAISFTALYVLGMDRFMTILTDDKGVTEAAKNYYKWIYIIPIAGFAAFIWDGIMVGATAIKPMVYATLAGSVAFFSTYVAFNHTHGNDALWLSFIIYLSIRGLVQTIWYKSSKTSIKNGETSL